jgi:hypothetical protein
MRRSRPAKPIALTVCAALLAGGGAAAIAEGQSTTPAAQQEIDFKIAKEGMKFVDATKPKGPSTGDRFLDYGKIVDTKSGASRGYVFQTCDFAKVGRKQLANCYGGVQLAGGRITFSDVGSDTGRFTSVAITGGTGAYATARGTIVFDAHKEHGKNITARVLIQP